jgi:hypothetical protein
MPYQCVSTCSLEFKGFERCFYKKEFRKTAPRSTRAVLSLQYGMRQGRGVLHFLCLGKLSMWLSAPLCFGARSKSQSKAEICIGDFTTIQNK